jgi:hypothetical protein
MIYIYASPSEDAFNPCTHNSLGTHNIGWTVRLCPAPLELGGELRRQIRVLNDQKILVIVIARAGRKVE